MSCRGVHFALTAENVAGIVSIENEAERLTYLQEVIEENYFSSNPAFVGESDKAWDAMHRALADGKLNWEGGEYPLNHAVLAGDLLYTEADYVMSLKDPEVVRAVSAAIDKITESELRCRYWKIDTETYQDELSEEDFQYTWQWFQSVRKLYRVATTESRYVLFTVDQ